MLLVLTNSVIIHFERFEKMSPDHHLDNKETEAPLAKQSPSDLRSRRTESQGEDVLLPTHCHSNLTIYFFQKHPQTRTQAIAGHREVLNCLRLGHQTITTDFG